jgi:hypothetical protein
LLVLERWQKAHYPRQCRKSGSCKYRLVSLKALDVQNRQFLLPLDALRKHLSRGYCHPLTIAQLALV